MACFAKLNQVLVNGFCGLEHQSFSLKEAIRQGFRFSLDVAWKLTRQAKNKSTRLFSVPLHGNL